ncbi:MAG TPA: hypothetical protein VLH41_01505 [Thermoanaerobaculia bacterium]|nr:hypothetical protein [Thermoanaerobaculia bacterium]
MLAAVSSWGLRREVRMPVCEVCNDGQAVIFEIVVAGKSHLFDSFECAIHALWPSSEAVGSAGPHGEPSRAGSSSPDRSS